MDERPDKDLVEQAKVTLRAQVHEHYREVLIWPHPALAGVALPAREQSDDTRRVCDALARTLSLTGGGGLSAPQVGIPLRIIVVKVLHKDAGRSELVLVVNPEVVEIGKDRQVNVEGCLSLPSIEVPVERAAYCRVRGMDYQGKPVEIGGSGVLAATLQHEIDHLDGKTIADSALISPLKRDMIRRRLTKAKARGLSYLTPSEVEARIQ